MKRYYKYNTCIVLLGITLMITPIWSCRKFVTLPLPNTQVPSGAVFNDMNSMAAALNGAYSEIAGYNSQDTWTKTSMFADELISKYSDDDVSQKNLYQGINDFGFFSYYYGPIYWTNFILDGLDKATNIPVATRNEVKGECLFLRAFSYFNLVNLYGAVPLYTGSDAVKNSLLPASPPADIYKQIIADLTAAVPLVADDNAIDTRTKASKQTVNALFARVYLYTKDYANAITAASAVISSPSYSMNSDLNAVFQNNSTEIIWQLWNENNVSLGGSYVPYDPSNQFYLTVRTDLVNAFEAGDARKDAWLKTGTDDQATYYYPYKWKRNYAIDGPPEFLIEFRLAEMYLIRAEALAQTNNVADGLNDIYVIRNRAGLMAPLAVTTSDQLLDVVASERRKELSFEGCHRWFDLIRTGKAVSVLAPLKPGFDEHLTILPIPLNNVLKFNPNLKQNPGYN